MTTTPTARPRSTSTAIGFAGLIDRIAGATLRSGLVAILAFFGAFKFTEVEAKGIEPLMANSPLFSWLYALLSVRGASNLIGTVEILVAVLLALRPLSPQLALVGSVGAVGIFLSTLSFLATTPGVWASVPGFPLPVTTADGGFLLKDWFLLGAALWSTADCLRATLGKTS